MKGLVPASEGIESVPEKLPVASRRREPPSSEKSVSFTTEVSTPPLRVPSRSITYDPVDDVGQRSAGARDQERLHPPDSGRVGVLGERRSGLVLDMTTNIDRDAAVPKPRVSVPTIRVAASAPSWTRRPSNAELSPPTPRVPVSRPLVLTTDYPAAS